MHGNDWIQHVCGAQHILPELRDVYVAGARFYTGRAMNLTADVESVFQHALTEDHAEVEDTLELAKADDREGLLGFEGWMEIDEDERTW